MRCLAPVLLLDGIRVNVTLPGAVRTPFMDKESWSAFPAEMFTTVENIVAAVAQLMDDPKASGIALEVSQGNFYPREQHAWIDEGQKQICTAAGKFDPKTTL
ncbi:15-hydroxyprostaglandin dehydrogenase [Ophiostoma piceae UAMH 11346]|uniref:15-hydroxyprostaglandin dehydrogenase n=1 Tax=Ophiostoma piceae (strain UAMH 11346) TaxID=1262450 RepID=S3BVB8_OPHP1|nr:15-hydroxyprostaglandin dehydrogenase [Ophiostoma piceae UAMH 11346]